MKKNFFILIWFSHTFFTILPFLMHVRNFHDDETLPRSVEKIDCESASQCETPPKKTCPVFDRRKMLSVNSDPQCENKKKNAQCDFSYSM